MEDNRYACIYCGSKETVYIGDMENIDGSPPEYEYFCLDCHRYFDEIKEEKQTLNTRIDNMTPEQVRFELAVLRGADQSMLIEIDAQTGTQRIVSHIAFDQRGIPDWPHDASAALALCLEIADRDYTLNIYNAVHADGHDMVCADFFEYGDSDKSADVYVTTANTSALALSKLALLALREASA